MKTKLFLTLALVALALAACGDDKSSNTPTEREDTGVLPDTAEEDVLVDAEVGVDTVPDTAECPVSLAADGPTTLWLAREERVDVSVTVFDCDDAPVADAPVEFAIVGDAAGAALRAATARTDASGVATASMLTGTDAEFELTATFADSSVTFDVRVSSDAAGDLSVTVTNDSGEDLAEYSVYLFEGVACADIDEFDPLGAADIIEPVTSLTDPVVFGGLAPADDYTVAVQGNTTAGALLGWGCIEAQTVADREVTESTVSVTLLPVVFTGIYDLDNRFDLAGALPPSVEDTLRILDELTDDNSLGGSTVDDEYGVDPAAFILDFIYREVCCWEAVDADPDTAGFQADFDSCDAQDFTHPLGDLRQMYTEDFTSWDGAQPSVTFMCGGISVSNETLQSTLMGLIEDNVPDIATNLLTLIGDLSRAVTEMHVLSELTVGEVAVGKNGTFTHVLEQMVVELHDLDGGVDEYTFDLTRAGFENLEYSAETTASEGNVLEIPEHSFRLDFGRLLRFVFTDVLIPTLDCDADHDGSTEACTSTADLIGTWIDCDAVATYLYEEVGLLSEAAFRTVCLSGIEAAGEAVESALESSIDAETTLTLTGSCSAGEVDAYREATTLVGGTWDGELVEDETSYGAFDGEFDGERTADLD